MYADTTRRAPRHRARVITSLTAATVTVLGMLFAAPAANAAEPAAEPAPAVAELPAAEQANLDALLAASDTSGEVPVFNIDDALARGADRAATEQFAATFVQTGGTLTGTSSPESATISESSSVVALAAADCRGRTGFTGYYWFGPQTALDSCLTTTLINGISIAAAGGGVYTAASALTVAGLPSSAVVGVVSAVLALGVVFLNVCKDTSSINAIYLNGGVPGVVSPSCWAQ
ncbi:outer membrane protein [Microbacterium testaceum StLB037]|uniref:Outer membrane protein n=1 Tax=Microbacterium testaceum (strain StLB037) TaxID=979556 RepID=E8N9T3_MICTS|nr:hypothetical protein [Microbacterium testaceum]BAJ74552.1 outer membrane protein [Microbacterium testaceum StLB037]